MISLLFTAIIVLAISIIILSAKICLLRHSAKEIASAFHEKLEVDTNTPISISSYDPYMRHLASQLNNELYILRKEHHRYCQGDQEIKTAVTNISHDLRTPLTAIYGYLDLLDKEEVNETTRRYLEQIEDRVNLLKNLAEELFRYSMVSSKQELKLERIDIRCLLEESLISFYALMQERKITPKIQLPKKPIFRELDLDALGRVFSNIISNAIKYSDGDFAVSMDDSGRIIFTNSAKNLNPVITEKLFDRFFTVETSRNSSGLGLSIAKLLTEQMGGTISATYQIDHLIIELIFE